MLEILGKTNIDFMGKRRWAFLFSGIMVVLGIVALDSDRQRVGEPRHRFRGWDRSAVEVRPSDPDRRSEKSLGGERPGQRRAARVRSGEQTPDPPEDLDDHRGKGCRSGRGGLYEGISLEPFRGRFQHGNRTDHRAETSSRMPSLRSSFPLPGSFSMWRRDSNFASASPRPWRPFMTCWRCWAPFISWTRKLPCSS